MPPDRMEILTMRWRAAYWLRCARRDVGSMPYLAMWDLGVADGLLKSVGIRLQPNTWLAIHKQALGIGKGGK